VPRGSPDFKRTGCLTRSSCRTEKPLASPAGYAHHQRQANLTESHAANGFAVGDAINIATGNVFEQQTDYTTAGKNPLAFIRLFRFTISRTSAADST
jgi:hypothetical protein